MIYTCRRSRSCSKSNHFELPERQWGEGSWGVHISLQLLLESENMKSSIRCFSSKQIRLNDFFLVPLILDLTERGEKNQQNFSNHMQLGVIYDSLSVKAFNTNSGGNKQIAARDHESPWHGAPTVMEKMPSTVCNTFNKVPIAQCTWQFT